MAMRNINIFEQHVEKIVLAVAAAGALFMGYLALTPVALQDNPDVHPQDVEAKIADQIKSLDQARDRLPKPSPMAGSSLVDAYREYASANPLGNIRAPNGATESLAKAQIVPDFGPHNLQPGSVETGPTPVFKAVVPEAPQPELVHAVALQPMVCIAPPQGVDAGTGLPIIPTGMQLPVSTRNVVVIDGYIPVGQMVADMDSTKLDAHAKFVPDLRRGLVYRVRVKRSELLANGKWSDPQLVTPAKGSPAPTDILTTAMPDGSLGADLFATIDSQFQQIQLPTYYWDKSGQPVPPPILARPIPDSIVKETAKLHNDIQTSTQGGPGFVVAPGGTGMGAMPGMTGGPATQDAPMFPPVAQIVPLEVQPFAFWDDTVRPDGHYKYYVQVELVNPGFGWKFGLADSTLKTEPVIPIKDKGFVFAPGDGPGGEVTVHSDMAFFIQGLDFAGKLTGKVFKQADGRWYEGTFTIDRGMDLSGSISLPLASTQDVDTRFALVDYQDTGRNNGLHVILRDPTGNLVARDTSADWKNDDMNALEKKVADDAAAAAAAATSPAPTPAGVMVPTTTPAPMGRGPVTPPPATSTRPRGPVTGAPITH